MKLKWGKSIQQFQRYAFRKVWTQFVANFGPWVSPYWPNGQMTMPVHYYKPRQFHKTSNGENPWSGYREYGFRKLGSRPPARPDRDDNTLQPRRLRGRAGVKYVLSNTNTKIWIFQIQIQIFCLTLIQIKIQIHRFKYKYNYVQPNKSAKTVPIQNRGNSINPKIYAHGVCFLMFRWHLKFTPLHWFQEIPLALEQLGRREGYTVVGLGYSIRSLTRNARVETIHFAKLKKNRGRNTTFPHFFSFSETWRSGVEMMEHMAGMRVFRVFF